MKLDEKAKRELILRAYERGITKPRDFMVLKNEISEEYKIDSLPNYGLAQIYDRMVKKGEIKEIKEIRNLLKKAKMRTLSGVAVVSVLTQPYACPGKCLYCPTEKDMPKSYLSNEPAVMRAILCEFDPYRQVEMRLSALQKAGHSTDKIELIIMGGSFNALPEEYQYWFVARCFEACNDFSIKYKVLSIKQNSKTLNTKYEILNTKVGLETIKQQLKNEQLKNEKARSRIIGLTLETRPDLINEKELLKFRELGCTRIEIGVQSIYDDVLKKNKRGHGVKEIIEATKLMKDFGFKVSYHMMPGLYGSNLKKDLQMFKELFSDEKFQPDQIKIYPCVVVKGTELYDLWRKKKYKPYTDKQLIDLICEIKKIIPPYVRISRLIRDIPEESIEAGNKITNLRQVIANRSQKEGWGCKCIRCREIRDSGSVGATRWVAQDNGQITDSPLRMHRIDYEASGGKESFLELVDNDSYSAEASKDRYRLYAMLRLRIVGATGSVAQKGGRTSGSPLRGTAIIRELHTYGEALDVGETGDASQHKGFGKKLIIEAEKIARGSNCSSIAVISGVGAREYYRKLGYKLKNTYMIKYLHG